MSRDYIGLNQMKQAPHPPYSPDLAPSDCFLFGYVKRNPQAFLAFFPSFLMVSGLNSRNFSTRTRCDIGCPLMLYPNMFVIVQFSSKIRL
jgi:hypothetical protein